MEENTAVSRDLTPTEVIISNILNDEIKMIIPPPQSSTGIHIEGLADATLKIAKVLTDIQAKEKKQVHSDVKRIMSHNFGKERNKQRITDVEKNKELLNHLGSAFTVIESEVKDDLREYLIDGKDIFSIVPKRDHEKDEEETENN